MRAQSGPPTWVLLLRKMGYYQIVLERERKMVRLLGAKKDPSMEDVEEVKRRGKGKEIRYGNRYRIEVKLLV